MLCSPWPIWRISGSFIAELPSDPEKGSDKPSPKFITETDAVGHHILSFVPKDLRPAFLSLPGQKIVSLFSPSKLNTYM
jgi:hypothetical protein